MISKLNDSVPPKQASWMHWQLLCTRPWDENGVQVLLAGSCGNWTAVRWGNTKTRMMQETSQCKTMNRVYALHKGFPMLLESASSTLVTSSNMEAPGKPEKWSKVYSHSGVSSLDALRRLAARSSALISSSSAWTRVRHHFFFLHPKKCCQSTMLSGQIQAHPRRHHFGNWMMYHRMYEVTTLFLHSGIHRQQSIGKGFVLSSHNWSLQWHFKAVSKAVLSWSACLIQCYWKMYTKMLMMAWSGAGQVRQAALSHCISCIGHQWPIVPKKCKAITACMITNESSVGSPTRGHQPLSP